MEHYEDALRAVERRAEIFKSTNSDAVTVALFVADGDDWRMVNEVLFNSLGAQVYAFVGQFLLTGYY